MDLIYAVSEFSDAGGDFRGACWGMSKDEVKRWEGLVPLSEGEGYITYWERVMGLDSVVGYHFRDGLLVEAGYAFREQLGGGRAYIREYSKVKGLLKGSYGEPVLDEGSYGGCGGLCVRCSGEECGDDGTLVYLSEWMTGRSVIRLVLMGGESGHDFGLLHRSREHEMRVGKGEG
jgi:hypothetical protein